MSRRSAESSSEISRPKKLQKQIHTHHEIHLENDHVSPSLSESISDDKLIPKLPTEVILILWSTLS